MFPENFPAAIAQAAAQHAAGDLVACEQWLDILTGRTFRQSLLVAADALPQVRRNLDPGMLAGMHLIATRPLQLERTGQSIRINDGAGRELRSDHAAVAGTAKRLIDRLPNSIAFEACLAGLNPDDSTVAADALLRMVVAGMLDVSTSAQQGGELSELPVASRHAHWDCEAGRANTVNPRHEMVVIDPIARLLLPLLDGTRTRESLGEALIAAVEAQGIQISHNGLPVADPGEARRILRENLPAMLQQFARMGVLAV